MNGCQELVLRQVCGCGCNWLYLGCQGGHTHAHTLCQHQVPPFDIVLKLGKLSHRGDG